MIGPLSGVKTSTHISGQDAKISGSQPERQQAGGTAGLPVNPGTAPPRGDSLEVSSAALNFNGAANSRPVAAVIETREEAAALLARIQQQFEEAGALALSAQAGVQADQVSSLLKAAP
jgi:hypothetical protein